MSDLSIPFPNETEAERRTRLDARNARRQLRRVRKKARLLGIALNGGEEREKALAQIEEQLDGAEYEALRLGLVENHTVNEMLYRSLLQGGGVDFFNEMRERFPKEYMRLTSKLVVTDVNQNVSGDITIHMAIPPSPLDGDATERGVLINGEKMLTTTYSGDDGRDELAEQLEGRGQDQHVQNSKLPATPKNPLQTSAGPLEDVTGQTAGAHLQQPTPGRVDRHAEYEIDPKEED